MQERHDAGEEDAREADAGEKGASAEGFNISHATSLPPGRRQAADDRKCFGVYAERELAKREMSGGMWGERCKIIPGRCGTTGSVSEFMQSG